jgi:tRNA (cmo5U34)-methyltransferase
LIDGCLACDLAAGRRDLPGGRIHETEHWLVEHCVGPLGVGTLVVKPKRHVVHLWKLRGEEAAELGLLLRRVSKAVARLTSPDQVYVCLWAHAEGEPAHVHFVVQPVTKEARARYATAPALQAAMFSENVTPRRQDVEAFAERARAFLQGRFIPEGYLESMYEEIPRFDDLQEALAEATRGMDAKTMLELGSGTGETARRVLAFQPHATLVGVDESPEMLAEARAALPPERISELLAARIQDPLPRGPFDLVFSALTVHHLDACEKQDLFKRVADVLVPGGRFVLADVVVPPDPADAVIPLTPGFDLPDRVADQLAWLRDAGFEARVTWSWKDLAVIAADRR